MLQNIKKLSLLLLFFITTEIKLYATDNNTITGTVTGSFDSAEFCVITPSNATTYVSNDSGNPVNQGVKIITNNINTVTGFIQNERLLHPKAMAITPSGTKVYVANQYGGTPYNGYIFVIDTNPLSGTYNTIIGEVTDLNPATFFFPSYIAITPDGTKAYVSNQYGVSPANGAISIINTQTDTVTGIVTDVNNYLNVPSTIAINPAGTKAYVINRGNSIIPIIDIASNTITGIISGIPNYPEGVAFNHDGTKAYIASRNSNTVSIIRTSDNTVTGIVSDQGGTYPFDDPYVVIFTPDGSTAYVSNVRYSQNQAKISIIDSTTNTVTGYMADPNNLISNISNMAITSTGENMYLSSYSAKVITGYLSTSISILPPINLAVTSTVDSSLSTSDIVNTVTWSAPEEGTTPESYNIYRDSQLTDLIATVLATDTLEYLDDDRQPDTTYNYYITSIAGASVSSPAHIAITTPAILPVANLAVTSTDDSSLAPTNIVNTLTWSAPTEGITPESYNIYRDSQLTDLIATVLATDTLEFLDDDRQPDTTYNYYITSIAGASVSSPAHIAITTGIIFPPDSVNLHVSVNGLLQKTNITNVLSWDAPTEGMEPTSYLIYRDADLTELIAIIPATMPHTYVDQNLDVDTTYSYYLVSVNGVVSSTAAFIENTTPAILPPCSIIIERIENKLLQTSIYNNVMTWSNPTEGNQAAYYLIYDKSNLLKPIGVIYAVNGSQFIVPNINPLQTQTYWIVSVNGDGDHSIPTVVSIGPKIN